MDGLTPDIHTEAVYDLLRQVARQYMRRERVGHILQTTALAHDAWIRLAQAQDLDLTSPAHLRRLASRIIRHLLADHARGENTDKRGGCFRRFPDSVLIECHAEHPLTPSQFLDLHEALETLAQIDPRVASLVDLRYFGGLTLEEAAAVLSVSMRTATTDWARARSWLRAKLEGVALRDR